MSAGKFEIFKGKDDQFFFWLRTDDDATILTSRGYRSKSGCFNGIDSAKIGTEFEESFERRAATDGGHFFEFVAEDGQLIATSQTYASLVKMENGIGTVMHIAPDACVEDLT